MRSIGWTKPCMDHPRVCGEKPSQNVLNSLYPGSPPRVRGKVERMKTVHVAHGITPACAGKRTPKAFGSYMMKDHPRVCGEKRVQRGDVDQCSGSPPRVRGKVSAPARAAVVDGITPACAGKRQVDVAQMGIRQDHPRVCGEKLLVFVRSRKYGGSPPRVRGKD